MGDISTFLEYIHIFQQNLIAMTDQEKLYETLGELLFVIAKADGKIQNEERDSINTLLSNHTWGSQIKWSFDYEEKNNTSTEETYNKVINFCHSYGPSPVYEEFIDAMKFIAKSSDGISENESEVISSFSEDLIARFQKDLDRLN